MTDVGAPVEQPASAVARELSRRGFIAGAAGGALGLAGLAAAIDVLAHAADAVALAPPALAPDSPAVRATMSAFADTIVPGPAGGADPHPGAVEAGAVEEIYDPFYGASGVFPVLHDDLLVTTPRILGRDAAFELSLPYRERERVLLDRITAPSDGGSNPYALLYAAAGVLVYVAYYGTARSTAGVDYIRFPPHSDGYFPGHSYRVRFRGMTRDGNPR